MENVVPGHLQRLRAADIIRMAGLAAASVGQEYYRSGAVHSTSRRGALLLGVVELPPKTGAIDNTPSQEDLHRFLVEVECVAAGGGSAGSEIGAVGTGLAPGYTPIARSWLCKCTCSSHTQGKGFAGTGQRSTEAELGPGRVGAGSTQGTGSVQGTGLAQGTIPAAPVGAESVQGAGLVQGAG